MKLSKTKKILLLVATLGILATTVVIPIMLLNNNEDEQNKKDVEKVIKILEEKNEKEKIITLPSNTKGKIIANNQAKIIAKIKTLIGSQNLKEVKIEVSMQDDANISTTPQKIIIKLTKNEVSKEVKDFSIKKKNVINEEIKSIKKIFDAKSNNELIITLPSDSNGKIISKVANKNTIEKKLRILIDPSNTNGENNHTSLKGTTIEISMNVDAPISTTPQDIIVSISKSGGRTLTTTKTFQVKRAFTSDEDIATIRDILDAKINNDLIIILPRSSSGNIIGNATNKNEIIKKLRMLIDSSNTNGVASHVSLRGTTIEVSMSTDAVISTNFQDIIVTISKNEGTPLKTTKIFKVKKESTASEDIIAIRNILNDKTGNDLIITLPANSTGSINDNRVKVDKKLMMLIDPSNINGDRDHWSLRGTSLTSYANNSIAVISTTPQPINILITKTGGTNLVIRRIFRVKKST